jgi:O-antigen/teichoic acid export membrane protein
MDVVLGGLCGLIIAPLVLSGVGTEAYGVWALVLSITGQFVLLEMGIRNALVSLTPRLSAGELSRTLSSAVFLVFSLTAIVSGVSLLLLPFAQDIFALPAHTLQLFRVLFIISLIDVFWELLAGNFLGVLTGAERYEHIALSNIFRLFLYLLLVASFVFLGFGIVQIALLQFTLRFLQRAYLVHRCQKDRPGLLIRPTLFHLETALTLLRFGAWGTMFFLSVRLSYQTDSILLGVMLGPVAVTVYSLPLLLVEQLRVLALTANALLLPRLSAFFGDATPEEAHSLVLRWTKGNQLMNGILVVPLLVNGPDFLLLWLGPEFKESGNILVVLLLPLLLTLPALSWSSVLLAKRDFRTAALIQGVEAVTNLLLSIWCIRIFGVIGAPVGTLIPAVVFSGLLLPWMVSFQEGIPFGRYLSTAFGHCVPQLMVGGVIFLLGRSFIGNGTWVSFLANNLLCGGVATVWYFLTVLSPEERAYFFRHIKMWQGRN